jgi:large repetitive protein
VQSWTDLRIFEGTLLAKARKGDEDGRTLETLKSSLLAVALLIVSTVPVAAQSDLGVTKDGPAEAGPGTDVTYAISVTNSGPSNAVNVELEDVIPPGMTFVFGANDPSFNCTYPAVGDPGTITCTNALMTAGATANFAFIFHIPAGTPSGTTFSNVATVSSATPDPNGANDSDTVDTTVRVTDLAVMKDGPTEAAAGANVTYNIAVINGGPDDATDAALSDTIPAGMTFVSGTNDPSFSCTYPLPGDPGTITCTNPLMAAGTTANFTFVFNIPPDTAPGTTFTNTAAVTTLTFDSNEENDTASIATTTPFPPQADLQVMKVGPSSATPDSDVSYTITLVNGGPGTATNVTLNDTLPGTMTFVSFSQDAGVPLSCTPPAVGAGGTLTCTAASFPAGETATLTLTGHIPADTQSGTTFDNTVTVASDNDPNDDNNQATTALVVSSVDVSVVKTGPANATAGDQISYTIVVANSGPDAATNVTLIDELPDETTFVSLTQNNGPPATLCTNPGVGNNGPVTCEFAVLGSGVSAQFTLTIEIGNTTEITNTATVSSDSGDLAPGNDESSVITVVTPQADLTIVKTGPTTAAAGGTITYNVTVTNEGPSDAINVRWTDTLPPDTTFVSNTQTAGPTFSCANPVPGATGTITCIRSPFTAGSTATFTLVFAVSSDLPAGSTISNTADITADTADPDGSDNSSTTSAITTATAEVSVTKSGPGNVAPNTNITYVVTVSNAGPAAAADVTLTDVLPANTTFVSATQTGGPAFACTPPPVGSTGTITCTIASLPANTTATFDFVVRAANQSTGTIENTAVVTSPTDPTPANNSSTTTAAIGLAGIPTLSPLALALLALSLAGIAIVMRS